MREIKFRSWDVDRKKMCDVHNLAFHADYIYKAITIEQELGLYSTFVSIEKFELMQYTGLKDKNGFEIFEGDIVAIENHPFQKTDDCDVGMEINGNYEVGWNADDLTWCAGSLLLARVKNYVRVIGNIYENNDLLEVSE